MYRHRVASTLQGRWTGVGSKRHYIWTVCTQTQSSVGLVGDLCTYTLSMISYFHVTLLGGLVGGRGEEGEWRGGRTDTRREGRGRGVMKGMQ